MNSDDLRKLIQQKMAANPSLRSVMKRIQSGNATFKDTADYSRIYSELLGKCLSENVLDLTDREAAAADILRDSFDHTNSILSQVQTNIDKKNGINIRPQTADFPLERVLIFSHSLVDPTVEDSVIQRRARSGSTNISMSHHDDYMETNARFRSKAGLKCYIDRQTDGKCCKWCTAIAGRYVYGEEPHDVYRRHDNCGCSVIYENGRQRQDVWSKRTWEKPKVGAGASPPTKFSPEQARALEQEKLRNIHGLSIDNERGSGIIRVATEVASNAHSRDIELENIIEKCIKQDKPVFADNLARNFSKIPPEKGRYIISMHGTPNSVFLYDKEVNVKILANIIRSRKDYNGVDEIVLISCNTGNEIAGDKCFAQQLANELKKIVHAPTRYGAINSIGAYYSSDETGTERIGTFKKFEPKKEDKV